MHYGDEEINMIRVRAKELRKEKGQQFIYEGEVVTLAEKGFAPYFTIELPDSFDYLPIEIVKRRFPMEDRPEYILGNNGATVYAGFRKLTFTGLPLNERIVKYQSVMKKLHPSNFAFSIIHVLAEQTKYDTGVAAIDYRSPSIPRDWYNFILFASLKRYDLLGWFFCPIEDKDQWRPKFIEIIKTLKVLPGEEES